MVSVLENLGQDPWVYPTLAWKQPSHLLHRCSTETMRNYGQKLIHTPQVTAVLCHPRRRK